jgi:Flp pilus assembly protein TadB
MNSAVPGIVALLVSALLGALQFWWKSQEEKAREERKAAKEKEKEEKERIEREAREDRQAISQRLRTLETARQEHQVKMAEWRVELVAVTTGMARLEGKIDKIVDAVIGHRRDTR